MPKPKPPLVHGSPWTYKDNGCRCDKCREANTQRQTEQRKKWAERGEADPSVIPHGTVSGYTNWRCRCDECREAGNKVRSRNKNKEPQQGATFDISNYFADSDEFLASLE